MRIEQVGNRIIVRGSVDEILEHATALIANCRNVIANGDRQAQSSRPASVAVDDNTRYVPGSLTTVVEGVNA